MLAGGVVVLCVDSVVVPVSVVVLQLCCACAIIQRAEKRSMR